METVLSIEKYITNSKDERSSEKKEAKSIENIIKNDDVSENINSPSN